MLFLVEQDEDTYTPLSCMSSIVDDEVLQGVVTAIAVVWQLRDRMTLSREVFASFTTTRPCSSTGIMKIIGLMHRISIRRGCAEVGMISDEYLPKQTDS